jgi:threonine/homoserine/homoserine lactone efflux protein
MEQPKERDGWLAEFSREVISMPRRHVVVFLVATLLLVVVEVELTEGWHLVHLVELMGVMIFLYLLWAAWRVPRGRADPRNLSSKSK